MNNAISTANGKQILDRLQVMNLQAEGLWVDRHSESLSREMRQLVQRVADELRQAGALTSRRASRIVVAKIDLEEADVAADSGNTAEVISALKRCAGGVQSIVEDVLSAA